MSLISKSLPFTERSHEGGAVGDEEKGILVPFRELFLKSKEMCVREYSLQGYGYDIKTTEGEEMKYQPPKEWRER